MSGVGQKRTWRGQIAMSALPLKADIPRSNLDVSFGPKADSCSAAKSRYSITSSVNDSSVGGATRADLPGGEPNLTERLPWVHTERLENFCERTEAGEC
jgi:hypothetical protein